jgi:hypothetical protein
MLHDHVMSRATASIAFEECESAVENSPCGGFTAETACADRRLSDRVPFPAELVLAWNHNLAVSMRYRIADAGNGGYRIHSSLPMLEGTTGVVVRLLPGRGGPPVGQPVMVAWCRENLDLGGYDLGLRLF